MAELAGKGFTKDVTRNKFNIAGIDVAGLEQDIDYIFHVECELPMELYTELEETKKHLVHMTIVHADAALRRMLRQTTYQIAKNLQESVGNTVIDAVGDMSEVVEVTESADLSHLMDTTE